ncbi:MAG: DUF805 domain-containing protein [Proteobacteria bacterium]|nr:DUF805 domain-containing protein [Pseudomonadota bacterium]
MSQTTPYSPPAATVADMVIEYGDINILSARGRLGRVRYFAYGLLVAIGAGVFAGILGGIGAAMGGGEGGPLMIGGLAIVYIAMVVISVMLAVQRLHDLDKTGWLFLLMLIPIVNIILGLYLLFAAGSKGENRFGHAPPPNSTGIVIVAWLAGILYIGGILAAIAVPAYMSYQQQAQLMQQK